MNGLQRQLQSTSQNTQNILDELDEVKKKSCAENTTNFDKLQQALRDIRRLQDENKTLSQRIQYVEIERADAGKAHEALTRRSETFESDLRRAKQEFLALKQRLEEENSATLQRLKDANTKEKRYLQLIEDLEQEISYNAKHPPKVDGASTVRSDISMASTNRVATSHMLGQVRSQS